MNCGPLARLGAYEGAGQSILIDGTARALAALGHQLTVYVRRDDPSVPARLSAAPNITTVVLEAGPTRHLRGAELATYVVEFAAGLTAAWKHAGPDIVHAFGILSGQAVLAARGPASLPFVQTFGQLPPRERRRSAAFDDCGSLVRGAARLVATSSSQVFALMGLGADPAAIRFIPCGVDTALFAPVVRERGAIARPLRIATLGGLSLAEGIGDVISALANVDGVELTIGGGGRDAAEILADPDAARLDGLARRVGVADRVRFAGHVQRDDVASFLRSADVVVCPPQDDSMGTVALEAMACGMPLIVSTVGGLVDAVADGMTGIHVPPRAPRQLAYAIEALRLDGARRERFGRFGVERTTARYSWQRIAADTLEMYRSVAAKTSRLTQSRA